MKVDFLEIFQIRRNYNAYNRGGERICLTTYYIFIVGVNMPTTKLEKEFQSKLVKELKEMFPDAIIFKNENNQGIPDLTILGEDKWALLECKRTENSSHRPNQDYYVAKANQLSFARFIYPENKEEVLNELQQALRTKR